MQIETLQVYCDLVDTASFSLAAERNGITQSAVSQQIRALEARYQTTFFERGKKNFSITPEGRVFEAAAREIIAIYSLIDDRLKEIKDVVAGRLRVATINSIGLHELPPVVEDYKKRFPDVAFEIAYLRSNQVYIEVTEGRADIGLVAYPKVRKGVVVEEFSRDKLVMVCPPGHELSGRKRIKISDLEGLRFVAFATDLPTRRAVDRMFKDARAQSSQVIEFDDVETVKRAVEVEEGVSILPADAVVREVATGVLHSADLMGVDAWRPLGIVRKRARAVSPAMREFCRLLKAGLF